MTTGFLTGKFAPLTTGHIAFISRAATMVDKLFVVLSYDSRTFSDERLSLKNRLLWLHTTFKDLEHITITYVDESNIPTFPNGWAEWADLVKQELPFKIDKIFSSEPSYSPYFKEYWPTSEHVIIDAERHLVDISATRVRLDPLKYWSFMPSVVRQHYVKKVCVVGTESCGKTTLVKYLAKMFSTSWVEEYGRTFCEQDMCMNESLLSFNDYGLIATRRYELELAAVKTANKVVFSDTNALVTNFYCKLYEGRTNDLVSELEKLETYDLVLFLEGDVPWVADGLRVNSDRSKTEKLFKSMLADSIQAGKLKNVVTIRGNYSERLEKAIAEVNNLLSVAN